MLLYICQIRSDYDMNWLCKINKVQNNIICLQILVKQGRERSINITLRRVHATTVAVEDQ